MKWTDEQKKAIEHRNGSAIVSAAAGSGKTAILVERILSIISDEKNYTPADEIVVTTFTKKAAAELRFRLNNAIAEAAEKNNSEFLQGQLIRFQSARISTISSFCLDVIRCNIQKADLPVNFSLLDEAESSIMLTNAAELALNRFYEEFSQEKIKAVCDCFVDTTDEALKETVIKLREFLSNLTEPQKWRDSQLYYYYNPEEGYTYFDKGLRAKAIETAQSMADDFQSMVERAHKYGLDGVVAVLEKNRETFTYPLMYLERENYKKLIECCSGGLATFNSKLSGSSPIANEIYNQRKKLKAKKDAIADYIYNKEDFISDCKAQSIIIEALFELCDVFEEEYIKLKQDKNKIDFNDIEHRLLKLLDDENFAKSLSKEYKCIIIDEFQDSNDLQYEIFKRISDNEQNLFFVGDVKQSIYGFRAANPKNFAAICKDDNYTCLPLNCNFRSRREVVDTVNAVFTEMMSVDCGDVDYNDSCKLNYGADYKDGDNYRTELHFLNTEGYLGEDSDEKKQTHSEAIFAAERITEMLESGFRVQDKDGSLRPCRKSDFCILLRSTKDKAKIFKDRLKEAGIESVAGSLKDYLALQEVSLVVSLLAVIDNPLKDTELLNVLMSPLYMMTADEIAAIRLGIIGFDADELEKSVSLDPLYDTFKKYSLYTCVAKCAMSFDIKADGDCFSDDDKKKLIESASLLRNFGNEKCARFIQDFMELRSFMSNNSIERLVRRIYDSTDFFSVISVYEYSGQKVANLRRFLSYVSGFENSTGGTLSDFLSYINNIKENGSDLASASIIADNSEAVSIMTIHNSKGLEFPICFLCDMGKQLNKTDERNDVICSISAGIGMKFVDRERLLKYKTMAHSAVRLEMDKQARSEEMRLLYVAMTRAREKLIMTCCIKNGIADFLEILEENSPYKASDAVGGASVLSWVEQSVARYFKAGDFTAEENKLSSKTYPIDIFNSAYNGSVYSEKREENELVPDPAAVKRIVDSINYQYIDETLTQLPQKFTATDLAKDKDLLEDYSEVFNIYLTRPEFLHSDTISGKQVGDAYHHAMEHLSYNSVTLDDIKEQLIKLGECGIISERECKLIRPERLAAFFNSELGRRVCASVRVEREYPVFMEIPYEQLGISSKCSDTPIVQGIADLFFFEDDDIVLVDYKSDSEDSLEKMLDSYKKQVSIYKSAIEKMFSSRVKQCFIYSFSAGKAIDIT